MEVKNGCANRNREVEPLGAERDTFLTMVLAYDGPLFTLSVLQLCCMVILVDGPPLL